MLTAVMIHPPKFGAKLKSFDAAAAKALPGVVDVVETPRGVAVVGEHMWAAIKGRDAVTVEWDESAAETRGSKEIMAHYGELAAGAPAIIAAKEGDSAAAMAGAAKVIEARYEFPYLAHAALEPMNAVARMGEDGMLEVWGGHQAPDLYQYVASQVAGTTPDKVRLHVMKTGGGYGRRAVVDADVIVEAVAAARALNWRAPVKVQWTRDNDMKGGRYRPAYVHALKAGLDADGKIVAWEHHIVGQSILKGGPFEAMVKDGIDVTSVEGALSLPYAMPQPHRRADDDRCRRARALVAFGRLDAQRLRGRDLHRRAGGGGGHRSAGLPARDARGSPRHANVLRLAAEKAGWGTPAA